MVVLNLIEGYYCRLSSTQSMETHLSLITLSLTSAREHVRAWVDIDRVQSNPTLLQPPLWHYISFSLCNKWCKQSIPTPPCQSLISALLCWDITGFLHFDKSPDTNKIGVYSSSVEALTNIGDVVLLTTTRGG